MKPETEECIERELARLLPLRPSELLEARLAAQLEQEGNEGFRAGRHFLWTLLGGVAAACLAVSAVRLQPGAGGVATQGSNAAGSDGVRFRPVSAQTQLVSERQGDLVGLEGGRIGRRVYREFNDTIVWQDPASKTSVRWIVPRRESRMETVDAL